MLDPQVKKAVQGALHWQHSVHRWPRLRWRQDPGPPKDDQAGDKKSMLRLLGMVRYSSQYIPGEWGMTKPLRNLVEDNADWRWEPEHDRALKQVRNTLSTKPTLRFHDVMKASTDPGRCFTEWSQCLSTTRGPTSRLRVKDHDPRRGQLCTDRKGDAGDGVCIQQIPCIHLRQASRYQLWPSPLKSNLEEAHLQGSTKTTENDGMPVSMEEKPGQKDMSWDISWRWKLDEWTD